jgi:hypothetical protein
METTRKQTEDFFSAIEEGDGDTVQAMLDRGMPPDVIDDYQMSALFVAVAAYRVKKFMMEPVADSEAIVRSLLDAGADPDFLGEHFRIKQLFGTLLKYARLNRIWCIVTLLLERGADPTFKSGQGMLHTSI